MQHNNLIWRGFLIILLLITSWFVGVGTLHLYRYFSKSSLAYPETIEWSVQEINEDTFAPSVTYTFLAKDNNMTHTQTLSPHFHNPWAAEEAIQEMSKQEWIVSFSPSDPHNASIQNHFPLKESVYALCLVAISIYFLCLGNYVKKFQT